MFLFHIDVSFCLKSINIFLKNANTATTSARRVGCEQGRWEWSISEFPETVRVLELLPERRDSSGSRVPGRRVLPLTGAWHPVPGLGPHSCLCLSPPDVSSAAGRDDAGTVL